VGDGKKHWGNTMAKRLKRSAAVKRVRGVRDPEGTREAILKAAREVLAQDGKEGLSVAQVAQRAGVNRGTAYQHFKTREELIEATAVWVSEKIYHATFGDPEVAPDQAIEHISVDGLTYHLANFAMENPELGRIWLFELLSSRRPASDAFWRQYETNLALFAQTENAQPGIDTEVASVIMLASCFLWPVWARSHARTAKERQQMAGRFAREVLRMCLHGTLRPEKYADLDTRLQKARSGKNGKNGKNGT
jgi:AcrR family transcriptional regulator